MKILVSDLDGTIYRNKMVSAIDLKMINDFASRNMFVIATGRNENTFSFFSEHYDLAYQYVILCNGALIQDKNQQTIIKHSFNKDDDLTNIFEILHLYSNQQISVSLSFEKGGLYLPKWQDDLFDQVKANLSYEMLGICLEVVDKDLKVVLTDEAKKFVVDNGFDPTYGARPLKRYIQKTVETLAAKLILAGNVNDNTITIDVSGDTLTAR